MIGTGIGLLIAGIAGAAGTGVAAKIGSDAANRAGDLNAVGATKQIEYLTQKDKQDQLNWEATQLENRRQFDVTQGLNLDQYNKKEARLAPYRSIGAGATGTLADLMGVRMDPVPSGASLPPSASSGGPGSVPSLTGGTPAPGVTTASPTTSALPTIDPKAGDLGSQISSFFKSRGVSDTETPYWVQKWPELVARGQELGDPTYAQKRLAAADIFGGGGAPAASASTASKGFSVMPGSTAPNLSSLLVRTAPLSAWGN